MKLLRRVGVASLAIPTGFLASYAFANWWIDERKGFGRADLSSFVIWNAAFSALLFLLAFALTPTLGRRTAEWGSVLVVVVGVSSGFLFTVGNAIFLGPWFRAWSFPVLLCWAVGGTVGLGTTVLAQSLVTGRGGRA